MTFAFQEDPEQKNFHFPFKEKSVRVQQIASKVLSTLFALPKKAKVSKERPISSKEQEPQSAPTPTEKLNHLISVNNLFCQIMESDGIVGITLDRAGVVLDITENAKEIFGYEPSDTLGVSGYSFLHSEDVERARRELNENWDEKKGVILKLRCRSKEGEWFWTRFNVIQISSIGGPKYFLLGFKLQ
jgi:PAS domain S-box-containing protein